MIKLLSVESKGKKRTVLSYVAGQRVLDYLGRSLQVEKALTTLLKVPLEQHFELTERAVKGFKNTQKVTQTLLRDLAVLEAERYKNQTEKDPIFVLHRKEGDNEFMNIIVNGINDQNVTCFLSVGDDKGAGLFLLSGKEEIVKELGSKVAEILEGKGSFSRGNFQGKANKLSVKHRAEKLIREYLQRDKTEK